MSSTVRNDEAAAPLHCYIYYRVRAELDVELARASVCAMQAALAARTGVQGRLLQRAEDPGTWMECYENVRAWAEFSNALADEVAAHRVDELVDAGGARHLERFVDSV